MDVAVLWAEMCARGSPCASGEWARIVARLSDRPVRSTAQRGGWRWRRGADVVAVMEIHLPWKLATKVK